MNINISTDKSRINIPLVHQYLSEESYWAKNIPLETVENAIANSLSFGVYDDDKQVGFARVISDHATFAYLADVFILPEHRGKGLSKQLMAYILRYPSLQGLRRWMLATLDAHDLYKQFGFKDLEYPERFLEIAKPKIYENEAVQ